MSATQRAFRLILAAFASSLCVGTSSAMCPNPTMFASTGALNGFTGYSYVQTAPLAGTGAGLEGSDVTANLRGFFWALGFGNPVAGGCGHDNGNWPAIENGLAIPGASGWVISYAGSGWPGAFIIGTWGSGPAVNGCIDESPVLPRCMALVLNDEFAGQSYFTAMNEANTTYLGYDLALPNDAPIVLKAVPPPILVGVNESASDRVVSIAPIEAGGLDASLHLDSNCDRAPMVWGYRVYQRRVPRGVPLDDSRNRSDWTALSPIPTAIDNAVSLRATCSWEVEEDLYVAQTIVFDSGFELEYVSAPIGPIPCGGPASEPGSPQPFRAVERPARSFVVHRPSP